MIKKILFLFILFGCFKMQSQAPQAFKYQGIARNNLGIELINSPLKIRIGIRDLTTTGTLVYQETFTVTTNGFGLFNINIGEGLVTSGIFSAITWGSGNKFIEQEVDFGSGYQNVGTSQLLSVPYALYAGSSGSLNGWSTTGNAGTNDTVNFIGTTDSKNLHFRLNNIRSGRLDTSNTILGYNAGGSSTAFNTAIGASALRFNTSGYYNTAIGIRALKYNQTGKYNLAVGPDALFSNYSGNSNSAFGFAALYLNTTDDYNTAVGGFAIYSGSGGGYNTAIGFSALSNGGYGNTAVGFTALSGSSSGSGFANTAIGYAASGSTTGHDNTASGSMALNQNTTGNYNTAAGAIALAQNSIGFGNTAIGQGSLLGNTTGNHNTALGFMSFSNVMNYGNSTAIGYYTSITATNQVRLGNNVVTSIGGFCNWTNISDARFKKNIQENVPGLNFITKLRPVTYYLDMDQIASFLKTPDSLRLKESELLKGKELQSGFIAQDVEKAAQESGFDFSGVDKPKNANDYYGLRYAEFVVPLVKGMQEQQIIIEDQNKKIAELVKRIEVLEKNKN